MAKLFEIPGDCFRLSQFNLGIGVFDGSVTGSISGERDALTKEAQRLNATWVLNFRSARPTSKHDLLDKMQEFVIARQSR